MAEPIIFQLPQIDIIPSLRKEFIYESQPSTKLIKYGFNTLVYQLDMIELTSNPHYKDGLNFDLGSQNKILKKALGLKNLNQTFLEFWEILHIFKLLEENHQIYSEQKDVMNDILEVHKSIFKGKQKQSVKHNPKNASLIIQKFSDIDLDESAFLPLMMKKLSEFLPLLEKNGILILQFFDLETKIIIELIYYLSSLFTYAYMMKPMIVSELSSCKYLVLLGYKEMKSFPKYQKSNLFLISILHESIPLSLDVLIQCINAHLIPEKLIVYQKIKKYLQENVYDGADHQEMIQNQDKNITRWIEIFTNKDLLNNTLQNIIQRTSGWCQEEIYNSP
jgi:hypothetical protein